LFLRKKIGLLTRFYDDELNELIYVKDPTFDPNEIIQIPDKFEVEDNFNVEH
jgi:hypothetical protein